jgi:hypothetical protein
MTDVRQSDAADSEKSDAPAASRPSRSAETWLAMGSGHLAVPPPERRPVRRPSRPAQQT